MQMGAPSRQSEERPKGLCVRKMREGQNFQTKKVIIKVRLGLVIICKC